MKSFTKSFATFCASLTIAAQGFAADPGAVKVHSHRAADGLEYAAISMSVDGIEQVARPHDHVVLFDTSASQVGEHREQGLSVLRAFLKGLPSTDRVSLFAVDLRCAPMTEGFVAPSTALSVGVENLEDRFPAGATDMLGALRHAQSLFTADRSKSVVYIGDGMGSATAVRVADYEDLYVSLRKDQIPVHGFAVGANLNLESLGTLAHQTGGRVFIDSYRQDKQWSTERLGTELAKATQAQVLYLDSLETSADLLPKSPLPFRSDRPTIYLGRGDTSGAKIQCQAGSEKLTWELPTTAQTAGNTYLYHMWQYANVGQGQINPLAGNEMLAAAQQSFEDRITVLEEQGQIALVKGQANAAAEIGFQIRELDPANVRAKGLIDAPNRPQVLLVQAEEPAEPGVVDPDPAASPLEGRATAQEQDLIAQERNRRAAREQQMQLRLDDAKQAALQVLRVDPAQAVGLLDELRIALKSATDIGADARERMLRDLSSFRNHIAGQAQIQQGRVESQAQRERLAEATQELIEHTTLLDQRMEQLVDRVRSLIVEFHEGNDDAAEAAEEVGRMVSSLRPGNPLGMATTTLSEAAGQLRQAERLRALRGDRFLATLHQVELSHVPFPDEPPVLYPSPAVWQALTERRRKWKSVDLKKNNPNEQRIYDMLDTTVDIEFIGTTLSAALQHLADTYQIPIVPHRTELEELGVDVESETVDLVISGITLRSALKLILQPFEATYIIEDEVMKITSSDYALTALQTRVYPVADLVIPIFPIGGGFGGGLGGQNGINGQNGQNGQNGFGNNGNRNNGNNNNNFFSLPVPAGDFSVAQAGKPSVFDNAAIEAAKKKP
ncbi:MAG: hypothetical protein R3C01_01610 [Planctomycetaceae bacterium]